MASAVSASASGQDLPTSYTMVAENSCLRWRSRAAAFTNRPARTSTGCRFQDSKAFQAASSARSTCSLVALLKRPSSWDLCDGLIESYVFTPVIRSPPITTGYTRPNSARTVSRAVSMAVFAAGTLKSVSGSFLNSLSIIPPGPPVADQNAAGMYSKSLLIAIATLLLCTMCATPWAHEPIGQEVNLAFIVRNNLIFLPSATVDGKTGRFLLAVANARTALDSGYAATLPPAAWRGARSLQL